MVKNNLEDCFFSFQHFSWDGKYPDEQEQDIVVAGWDARQASYVHTTEGRADGRDLHPWGWPQWDLGPCVRMQIGNL